MIKVKHNYNLFFLNPELCKEWSDKNEVGPENYSPNSHEKVWWICKNNHEWEAVIFNRNFGNGCPHCSGHKVSKENNLLVKNPELCEEWSSKNKLGPENYTFGSNEMVWWNCKKYNHEWKTTISHRNNGRGCPFCSGKRTSKENNLLAKNPELCKEWSDKNTNPPDSYLLNSNKPIWWVCKKCNYEWKALISSRNAGRGCPNCCGRVLTNENNLLAKNPELCEEWSDKNENTADGYMPNSNKPALWVCKKCNHEWKSAICDRNKGVGCPRCCRSTSKKEIEWLNYLKVPQSFRNKTININGKIYRPDAIDVENKIVWEFYGDVWHSNPKKYNLETPHPVKIGKLHKNVYLKTIEREQIFKAAGYKLITIWESDWDELKRNNYG